MQAYYLFMSFNYTCIVQVSTYNTCISINYVSTYRAFRGTGTQRPMPHAMSVWILYACVQGKSVVLMANIFQKTHCALVQELHNPLHKLHIIVPLTCVTLTDGLTAFVIDAVEQLLYVNLRN